MKGKPSSKEEVQQTIINGDTPLEEDKCVKAWNSQLSFFIFYVVKIGVWNEKRCKTENDARRVSLDTETRSKSYTNMCLPVSGQGVACWKDGFQKVFSRRIKSFLRKHYMKQIEPSILFVNSDKSCCWPSIQQVSDVQGQRTIWVQVLPL